MFSILGFLISGVVLGYGFKRFALLRRTEKSIPVTIVLLLFCLGLSVGSNKQLTDNLALYGGQAALLAALATLGSILASWVVLKLFFGKGGKPHER